MSKVQGYAALNAKSPLTFFEFERRALRPHDVKIDILYCGVCHSDLHKVRNEWKNTMYPVVPGHEIVGRIVDLGPQTSLFKIGELVAVGCLVDACRLCTSCLEGLEQYCEKQSIFTYDSIDPVDRSATRGGYSSQIIVDEKFTLKIPTAFKEKDLPAVAPLLCAGITTYSPLRHWHVGKNSRVGVVGLGGLGHMAVQLACAMGAEVAVFTSSKNKVQDAKKLGAHHVVLSSEKKEMELFIDSLDFIINTVSATHSLDHFIQLLKRNGTMCMVGLPESCYPSFDTAQLIFRRKSLAGSLIGGIRETQEMLEFCAQHHILPEIEIIAIQKINEAFERMLKNDVKYRFVIDMASLHSKKPI